MSNDKKKYYVLDDLHEIISTKKVKGKEGRVDELTNEFFSKRRKILSKKKPAAETTI
jgi:hypothetical protein